MLPKIDLPTYELKLPSNGKEVRFRPFLVKEEKLLLMAAKSNDANEIIKTTKQVINNCLLDNDVNVDTLPFFDVDCLFIAMRAKSIGESIEVNYVCQSAKEDGTPCGSKFPVNIDISNAEVDKDENIKSEIRFSDNLIFYMKYPGYSIVKVLNDNDDSFEKKIKIIMASIDKIFNKDQYYSTKDFSTEELQSFIEGLTQEQFNKLSEFTSNFPSFYVKGKGKCIKCGKEHTVRYKDFVRFFQ
jgi:hypothetical protein